MSSRASFAGADDGLPARQHRRALGVGHREGRPAPGRSRPRPRLRGPPVDKRLGEPQRPDPGLRRLRREEGEDLLRRHPRGHLPLAGPPQRLQPRPVRMRGQEIEVLVPVARPVAQPHPDDEIAGDRAAGPASSAYFRASTQSPSAAASSASPSSRPCAVVCAPAAPATASQPASIGGRITIKRIRFLAKEVLRLRALYHSVCRTSPPGGPPPPTAKRSCACLS